MAKHTCHVLLLSVVCTISAAPLAAAQPRPTKQAAPHLAIVPLGALAGTYSEAVDVNARGQILAQSHNEVGVYRLWDRGEIADLAGK